MIFDPRPLPLEGRHVRLEPLEERHRSLLRDAVLGEAEVFRWMLDDCLARPAESDRWFDGALQAVQHGTAVVWATIRRSDGRFVGSTRFMEIRRPHRSLEIGNTWLRRDAQRTAINTEAKYLQLRHAFDGLGAVRVELKTDERNLASREAIVRIGAKLEGILRCYQTRPDGFVRNTAFYSMIAGEWPGVRAALEARLAV